MKTWRRLALVLVLALLGAACGDDGGSVTSENGGSGSGSGAASGSGSGSAAEATTITVGSADFAESSLVASMYAQALEHAGFDVETELNVGAREIYFKALEAGELTIVPEFAGSLTVYLKGEGDADPDKALENLGKVLPDGLVALEGSPAQSANVFVVTEETAAEHGLAKVSDLAGKDLTLGGPPECPSRPFCMEGLKAVYDVDFSSAFKPLDAGGPLTKEALGKGDIDVALLFSTDPGIPANGWVVLEDDKHLQQAENVVPVVAESVLDADVERLLNEISAALDQESYVELIGMVYIDGEDVEDVATAWLEEHGFLD